MAVACLKTGSNQFYSSSSSPAGSILSGGGGTSSSSVTIGGGGSGASSMNSTVGVGGHLQSQLTRSLERILEDANLSGELKLSGRKLKDFPKAAGKFNLSDTVIADLSRNRFCELPEDITSLAFLERLLVFHNTIRSIPDTIRGLHSLTYLDLRNNQLAVLPREICFLPLQVLLLSNNRLVTLPDELGRMEELTELDAACNQITHLPPRMGDLRNLRSLTLRNNQLVYLPRDLTCLQLVFLDVSSNRIATLPVELRLMSSLVDLELGNNPLTSPPASLCVRGLVHVFKYLETAAAREEKSKTGLDGHATLRRSALSSKNSSGSLLDGTSRNRRAHVDSGYSTSDGGGFEGKRWSQDDPHDGTNSSPKWSPIPMHTGFAGKPPAGGHAVVTAATGANPLLLLSSSGVGSRPELLDSNGREGTLEEEFKKGMALHEQLEQQQKRSKANDISPEGGGGDLTPDSMKADDKMRSLGNIQTYREYKEALRQQRNQIDIYRPKEALPQTPDSGGSTAESPLSNFSPYSSKSAATTPSPSVFTSTSSNQSSPMSPHHANIAKLNQMNAANGNNGFNPPVNSSPLMSPNRNVMFEDGTTTTSTSSNSSTPNKRPVQKVIPSRNITSTYQSPTHLNGNHLSTNGGSPAASGGKIPVANGTGGTPVKTALSNSSCSVDYAYVKPNSPCKASSGILSHNSVPSSIPKPTANGAHSPINGNQKPLTATVGYVNNAKPGQKTNKTVSWNRDVPTDKLSFTMRREFDKQKEETELIEQLRQIIETRLKMTLPEDIAPALTDGVVLCHLANHVRPRSVGSIHVPSPAVPKLTMARCRRNVDNFLDACRKIGVDEELICSCQDIVPAPSPPLPAVTAATGDWEEQSQQPEQPVVDPPNPAAMYRTIVALLRAAELWNVPAVVLHQLSRPSGPPPPPPPRSNTTTLTAANTNTTTTTELVEQQVEHCHTESQQPKKLLEYHFDLQEDRPVRAEERNVPGSLDLSCNGGGSISRRKRKFPSSKFGGGGGSEGKRLDQSGRNLNEIVEECEYDSDIGKFRCRNTSDYEDSESSINDDDSTAFTPTNAPINDLNTMSPATVATSVVDFNINAAEEDGEVGGRKIVSKRIEFFENGGGGAGDKIVNGGAQLRRSVSEEDNAVKAWEQRRSEHPVLSTILCLGTFLFAVVYLYLYPLPNY
uniref:Putative leucine-rich repeat lrr protein n=1 Tax=Culex tarsalis TaxID=7177 RepID=A0A1Q3FX35_CULTA